MSVYVLDKRKRPLMPCSEKRARKLLESGRARVHKLLPFVIRLTDRLVENSVLQTLECKLDPGSKVTGLALVRTAETIDASTGEYSFGFPRGFLIRTKAIKGFATGDLVKAIVPKGKKAGTHTGRVAVRASGSFNIQTRGGMVQGISHKHCKQLQRGDGYGYNLVAFTDAVGAPPRDMDASHPCSTSPA